MKYGICNETFQNWSFEETCRCVSQLGYQGIELAPFTFGDSVESISVAERKALASSARDFGLEVIGLHWLLATPQGLYLNHPDKSIRKTTTNYLKSLIAFCSDLGGRLMVFGSPKQRNVHPDLDTTTAWKYAIDAFRSCVQAAQECDVTIAIEPLAPTETDFINTAQQAVEMIKEIHHPNFRLHLDVKAMCSEKGPIERIIRDNSAWLAHFHANDANLRGPGFGDTDYGPIARALKDIGYQGYISVEVFDYKPDPETIARESLTYLKRFFG